MAFIEYVGAVPRIQLCSAGVGDRSGALYGQVVMVCLY